MERKRNRVPVTGGIQGDILEHLPGGVIALTHEGTVTYWNVEASRLFALPEAEALGRELASTLDPGGACGLREGLDRMRQDGKERVFWINGFTHRQFPNGVSLRLGPVRDPGGEVVGFAGLALEEPPAREADLAHIEEELHRVRQRLEAISKEYEEFAYIASHDLKEPLRGIYNYLSFLREDYGDRLDAAGLERIEGLQGLAARMHLMIEGLLDYSRAGRSQVQLGEVDLNAVVADVVDVARERIVDLGARVRIHGAFPSVRADRVKILQIFEYLLDNGLKFYDQGPPSVEIGCRAPCHAGEPCVFYVKDGGIGISSRSHEAIFRIFKRLHPRDRYGGGIGMGLTMARLLVEKHGGRIWVESQPGEGATVLFTLGGSAGLPAVLGV